jgi:hypothetical protein
MKTTILTILLTLPFLLSAQLRWVSFSADLTGTQVNIDWVTTEEMDVEYFVVERSINGMVWEERDTVMAQSQYGLNDYAYADNINDLQGNVIYRARSIDKNGNNSYSPMDEIEVEVSKENTFTFIQTNAFTAPALLVESAQEDMVMIQLFSMGGYLIKAEQVAVQAGRQQIQLPVYFDGKPDQILYRIVTGAGEQHTFQSIAM